MSRFATLVFFFAMWFHSIAFERQKVVFCPMEAVFLPFRSVVFRLWKCSFQTLNDNQLDFIAQVPYSVGNTRNPDKQGLYDHFVTS